MRRLSMRAGREERGAIAVLFAIVLIVLLGFVGLGVDVTMAYAKSQEIQNAADAGAIAEAQQCGSEGGCTKAEAQGIAELNVRSGSVAAVTDDPVGNTIKVTVTGESKNFFASIFGFDSFQVRRDATAIWDTPAAATTTLPLTISLCAFDAQSESGVPFVVTLPKKEEPNCSGKPSQQHAPAMFGYVGDPDVECSVHIDADGWVNGDNGNNPPSACDSAMMKAMAEAHDVILLPIFDQCRYKNANEGKDPCIKFTPSGGQSQTQFHIVGFAALELYGFKFSGGPEYTYFKDIVGCDNPERCVAGKFVEWVKVEDAPNYGSSPDYGATIVTLID